VLVQDKFGKTPLHYAVANNSERIVKLLVDRNSDVILVQDEHGKTPLHKAVTKKFESIVKLLIDKNTAAIATQNKNGQTPLHMAAIWKDDILWMLLENNKNGVVLKDRDGDTPLHWAAGYGKEGMIKVLVTVCPALVSIKNLKGDTALQASRRSWSGRRLSESTLKLLLTSSS
jgi:ankyrin repeat protein